MPKRLSRWLILLSLLALAGFLVRHFTREKPIEVSLQTVARGTVERTVANTRAGTLEACRRAKLSPGIGGQIAVLDIQEGDRVKAGQLLLALWNKDLAAEVELTRREAQSAAARLDAACLQADYARRDADRLGKLRESGAVSEDRYDRALTEERIRAAECEAARAALRVAESRAAFAEAILEKGRLIAPFSGVVAKIHGELNEYLTPSPPGIPTPPAVDLIDPTCFYVSAPIDEVDAADIQVGMPARIGMDAFGSRRFEGRVRRIADFVLDLEKQARTVDVEVEFTRPEDLRELLAGYSADVEIILETRSDTLRVPTQAVMEGRSVYRFDPGTRRLQKQAIRIGLSNWDFTEVIEGLSAGDSVVLSVDNPQLKEGVSAVPAGDTP